MEKTLNINIESLSLEEFTFDTGNICSDEQYMAFLVRLNIKENMISKFTSGIITFYAINGATNAKSTLGVTIKYEEKLIIKYTMQDLTEAANGCGTTIRQICRKFADLCVNLLKKFNLQTRMYKKYKDIVKLDQFHAFDFSNYTKSIDTQTGESLYMIKINKLLRRKIIKEYTDSPYVFRADDEIIRNDIKGKELYNKAIELFKLKDLK
jgi:hypothetical protein